MCTALYGSTCRCMHSHAVCNFVAMSLSILYTILEIQTFQVTYNDRMYQMNTDAAFCLPVRTRVVVCALWLKVGQLRGRQLKPSSFPTFLSKPATKKKKLGGGLSKLSRCVRIFLVVRSCRSTLASEATWTTFCQLPASSAFLL